MLSYLSVKNFAIIENIEVTFEEGMTALTGETGAGKSLLIDAIGLLLGDRATTSIVRTGADYCEVSGLFIQLSDQVKAVLKALDIPYEEEELLIQRQISPSSQNRIKVNRQTITLQDLKQITKYLADIHTQHDTKRLINPETYLELIDHYDESVQTSISAYQEKRQAYLKALSDVNKLISARDSMDEKKDYLTFQLDELKKHNLEKGEEDALDETLEKLENFDKIFQAIKASSTLLKDQNALESIYEASRELESVSSYDALYNSLAERIKSAYFELDDIKDEVNQNLSSLDFDPNELERLESRKHTFETLRRKYRKSIDELVDYIDEIETELSTFANYEDALNEKENALKKTYEELKDKALILREKRQTIAHHIEKTLIQYLVDLELKDAQFDIAFEDVSLDDIYTSNVFKDDGIDTVDFYLSTNLGEPLKPLSRVASGGELSRIMLALKEILIENMHVSLMIFDEIDTGVSGYIASQVAKKMARIAQNTQVIAITHLPQVAARANHHAYIYKSSDDSRTKAFIKTLDHDGRIEALAEMISTDKVTDSARKSAAELLK